MELDLFSVCDLIYSRLQHMAPDSLFYSAKYNQRDDSECEAILDQTTNLLKRYNKLYGGKHSANDRIGAYFSLMETRLIEVPKKVMANKGKDVSVPYVSPCYDLAQVLKLSTLARVGWNINCPGTIRAENQPVYAADSSGAGAPMLESLMQHVMESIYIAQMFLPDDLSEDGFQKSKVISLLLYSELGKTHNGDYSPRYSNVSKRREDEKQFLSHILSLGALDGYATQPLFFEPLSNKPAVDINMRICWEIKMIQTEFKYYTLYHQLGFSDKRRADFEDYFEEPTTDICKVIREQIVLNNPAFKEFFH